LAGGNTLAGRIDEVECRAVTSVSLKCTSALSTNGSPLPSSVTVPPTAMLMVEAEV